MEEEVLPIANVVNNAFRIYHAFSISWPGGLCSDVVFADYRQTTSASKTLRKHYQELHDTLNGKKS